MSHIELRIKPSKPYGAWVKALDLMGCSVVGLDLPEAEAAGFQAEAGDGIRCFLLTAGSSLPFVDSCSLAQVSARRKPPSLLSVGLVDAVDDVDSYLASHPNRVEALEVSLSEVRRAYETSPAKTFEWTSRLARAAGARGIPVIASSSAREPEELCTPLTKKAFAALVKSGRRSAGVRERRFLRKLELLASTRRREGGP
ncbi:MAG TPA: hypothetical protein VMS77_08680 [Conexivisphaerales archaeon]|nr:hypothetical protein [Conexivisphaerales archaeon]